MAGDVGLHLLQGYPQVVKDVVLRVAANGDGVLSTQPFSAQQHLLTNFRTSRDVAE